MIQAEEERAVHSESSLLWSSSTTSSAPPKFETKERNGYCQTNVFRTERLIGLSFGAVRRKARPLQEGAGVVISLPTNSPCSCATPSYRVTKIPSKFDIRLLALSPFSGKTNLPLVGPTKHPLSRRYIRSITALGLWQRRGWHTCPCPLRLQKHRLGCFRYQSFRKRDPSSNQDPSRSGLKRAKARESDDGIWFEQVVGMQGGTLEGRCRTWQNQS